jgi:hypothetical protein
MAVCCDPVLTYLSTFRSGSRKPTIFASPQRPSYSANYLGA